MASTIPAHAVIAVTVHCSSILVSNETITKNTNKTQRKLNGKKSSGEKKTQGERNRKYLGKAGLQF